MSFVKEVSNWILNGVKEIIDSTDNSQIKGTTTTVVAQADVAREIGAKIIAVTSQIESPLGKAADLAVVIKGRTKEDSEIDYMRRQITGEYNMAPLGTMFELSAMIFLDGLIADLMKELGKSELDLKQRHANAE
jgi:6-phospho-3-hexuloisomerase